MRPLQDLAQALRLTAAALDNPALPPSTATALLKLASEALARESHH
jgi:hypothetical protein